MPELCGQGLNEILHLDGSDGAAALALNWQISCPSSLRSTLSPRNASERHIVTHSRDKLNAVDRLLGVGGAVRGPFCSHTSPLYFEEKHDTGAIGQQSWTSLP